MNWLLWRLRVLLSAILLTGSVYFLSLYVITHVGLMLGMVRDRGLPSCMFGELKCSLAVALQVWVLCRLFKKARAVRAREQQQRLPPPEMDMV